VRRLLVAVVAWMLVLGAVAEGATRLPVYREPLSYKGVKKVPPLQPQEQPPLPTPIKLSDSGLGPHAIVDDAGTAHIVWSEGRGDADDAAVYCRLKRGAAACDATATLTWPKTYGTGDGPQYNIDNGGPRIALAGGQLIVFSKRYPTVASRPDGSAGSSNTIAWTSSDGGTNWSPAQQVGTLDLGQLAVIPGVDNSTVVNSGIDPFCKSPGPASWCLEVFRPGQFGAQVNLSTRSNDNYYPGIALDETSRPVAMVENLDSQTVLRRWNGNEPITDAGNWTTTPIGVADQPVMAGGPAGAFVMSKATFNSGPFDVRRVNVNGDGTVATGPPTVMSGDTAQFAALGEDPSGALHAAWQQGTYDGKEGVYIRNQVGGTFTPAQRLIDGMGNGQIDVAATADGGGFTVLNHTAGVVGAGEIYAVGFGNQAATGKPGLGGLEGGAGPITNVQCQKVGFGRFDVQTAAGCFFHGQGQYANVVVSEGEITINGLRIIPDAGSKIIIDPRKLRIDTVGAVRVLVTNPQAEFELFHGVIHRDLSSVVPGSNLFEFPSQEFKANLLGFDVAADIPVRLEQDGVHIPIDLELPPAFGSFTGHAELVADKSGLHLDTLKIHIGQVFLGVLTINKLDIEYTGASETWFGDGSVSVPAGGTLEASATFTMGDFVKATISFTPASPIPIGPFVYLLEIHGGFGIKPIQISAGAKIGAGAAVSGTAPISINGTFTMTFPAQGPASFHLHGTGSIFFFDLATFDLLFETDGYASFGADAGAHIGPLDAELKADGFIDADSGQFGTSLSGEIKLCVEIAGVEKCAGAGADMAVSNVGFAACTDIGGIEYPWDDFDPVYLLNPFLAAGSLVDHFAFDCSTEAYKKAPPRPLPARVAAAGGQVVSIRSGLPSATLVVRGDGGRPDVTVEGPGGVSFTSANPSAAGYVGYMRDVPEALIKLNKPKAGDWRIIPNDGSPAITEVLVGEGFKPATVKAKLGRGHKITYRIRGLGHGQKVQFVERGRFGGNIMGTVAKARGSLRFKPAGGRGGKRTVYALLQHDGMTTKQIKIGTYVAPGPPKPGAPKRVRAKHRSHTMTVNWKAAPRATRYVISLRGNEGTRLAKTAGAKGRKVKFTGIRLDERFKVSVRALAKSGRAGPARTVKTR
jgi:hypothetical protein